MKKKTLLLTATLGLMMALPQSALALIVVSPSYIDFSPTYLNGPSQFKTAQIQNWGQDTVQSLQVFNGCGPDVSVYTGCLNSLRPNESCTIQLGFTPYTPGSRSCSINVYTSSGEGQTLHVSTIVTGNHP